MRKGIYSARLPAAAALIISFALAFVIAAVDLTTHPVLNPAVLMVIALMIAAASRRCVMLWFMTVFSIATALGTLFYDLSTIEPAAFYGPVIVNRIFTIVTLLIVSLILHAWIRADQAQERNALALEEKNQELDAQRQAVAQQAQALQAQTQALQHKSAELLTANQELSRGQHMLEVLLDLSRSLRLEGDEHHAMEQICRTLAGLVTGASGAGILLIEDNGDSSVHCQSGFGDAGLSPRRIPGATSLASHVVRSGKTEQIEDLSKRPEFQIPQPAQGEPTVAVVATPLVVEGQRIGAIEIYSTQPRAWTQEQVALTESLAAQTSVTLENVRLFREIDQGRRRLQAIVESVPVGLMIASSNLEQVRLNAAAAGMLGMRADENIAEEYAHDPPSLYENGKRIGREDYALVRAAQGERVEPREVEIRLGEQKRVMVLSSAVPFRDARGEILGALECLVDISKLKTLERELETRRREAEEANVRKTRFLAAASHDIRTPANAISLLAELLKRSADSPSTSSDIPELAEELRQSASALVTLVSNVLDVTRFDTDKLELHESQFPLQRLLDEECRQVLPLAQAKGLALEIEPLREMVWLRADRIKLGRVIGNLLGNAIKFTDAGRIRVMTRRIDAGGLSVSVIDSGIGITPDNQARIFDEFWHLSDPRRAGGSGLGLSISKRLMEAMGGTLSVASEPGKGSNFTLTLPAGAIIAAPAVESAAAAVTVS